ncbi:MAG: 2Fe-2S iron-sulfur cluster binding domain-containing protein [Coriobacteriales bacterium]|jgi:ferredoxin-NADP reductase/ferredoxin|nr:2Fe-2S iron-sulfur cluster binding domain-containing protein [Coriobacteriales bacterium]
MSERFSFKKKPLGLLDMLAFTKLLPNRQARISAAPATPPKTLYINKLAKSLHPLRQNLRVTALFEEAPGVIRYRLEPIEGELAYFRPGQYLSFFLEIEGSRITRPFSISSSPADAKEGFYEVCIKNSGFATAWIADNWKVGTEVVSSGPEGHFYYEPARDAKDIICVAGGVGITPLRSLARSVAQGIVEVNMTLIYGCNTASEMLFAEEFHGFEKDGSFKVVYVVANEEVAGAEKGFITRELIEKYAPAGEATLFVCGPQAMYRYLEGEFATLNLSPKRLRKELFGEIKEVTKSEGYPLGKETETHTLTVYMGFESCTMPALGSESLLVAMERAGLNPPSRCRSGECGYCRSFMSAGSVFIPPEEEMRKQADRDTNHIHPCCSFPLEDIELNVPRAK